MDRSLLAPAILGGVLIVSFCFVEGLYLKDRWGEAGAEAAIMGQRFKQVPKEIGDWEGEDLPVDEQVKNTAGAVNYVSRRYKNKDTDEEVRLWLIVGHSRDICRHTPNVCYPASGFRQDGRQIHERWTQDDGKPVDFYTAKFIKDDPRGRHAERVFWAWNHPDVDKWEAPGDPRQHYGLSRALYKIYFTSNVKPNEGAAEDNVAAEFAKVMLPEVDKALFPETAATATPANADEGPADENVDAESTESAEPAEAAAE
jgi:hypothetical protein